MTRTRTIILAGAALFALPFASARALPVQPQPAGVNDAVIPVLGGCGPYGHRGFYGGCRPGGQWGGRPGWRRGPYWRHRGPYGWRRPYWHRRYYY